MRNLLFLCCLVFSAGTFASTSVDSYKEAVDKAENLILQKDRSQAIQVLLNSLQREKNKIATQELKKKIEELGSVFLSDKAQQLFETAVSMKRKDVGQSLQKINEALRVEPDNVQILTESARLLILKGDCTSAQDQILKLYTKNKYDENLLLAMGQIQQCLGAMDQYFSVRAQADSKNLSESPDWQSLELQRELFEKDKAKAKDRLALLQKMDSKNPQILYWQWRLSKLEGAENAVAKEKYNLSCNNINARTFRAYMKDPYFCNKQNEMESEGGKKQ